MAFRDLYKIIRLVGEGSFANVFRCSETSTGKEVALKRIKQDLRKDQSTLVRFKTELEIMQKLAGADAVIPILKAFPDAPDFAYVMPFAETNLQQHIEKRNSELGLHNRFAIIDRILSALANAHSRSIIHRDLSPHNVLMLNGEAYVADFGLGKDESSNEAFTRSSASGYGRSLYTAPEQLDKLRNASVRSDIYAIGKLMTFVMTGKKPDQLHDCSIVSVIRKATQSNPDERYQTVDELLEEYQQFRDVYLAPNDGFESLVEAKEDFATGELDWMRWHMMVQNGPPRTAEHIYYSFIEPITSVLLVDNGLEAYAAAVGSGIDDFLASFVQGMNTCLGTVGWPFHEATRFGKLLAAIAPFLIGDDALRTCFGELWDLAFVADRWDVQDLVKEMFRKRLIPECTNSEIVARILKSERRPDLSDVANIPLEIRTALKTKRPNR